MPYTRTTGRRITKTNWRDIACPFCSETVMYARLQTHWRLACGRIPRLSGDQKICSACFAPKQIEEYPRNRLRPDGRSNICTLCDRAASVEWTRNPENHRKKRDNALRWHYDITSDDYERILSSQGGGCAICGEPEPKRGRQRHLHVDHSHETDEVRGLLCQHCNHAIGKFRDNQERLAKAIHYLQRISSAGAD